MFKNKRSICVILVLIIGFLLVFFNRSHLGYVDYLLQRDSSIKVTEKSLIKTLETNPNDLFRKLNAFINENDINKNTCHGIAHKLGHESVELYGLLDSMKIAEPVCGAGFIHGVLEGEFGLNNKKALENITEFCEPADEACNHGVGHGIMVVTKSNVGSSLEYCDKLEIAARSDCWDGVFMHVLDNEDTGISKLLYSEADAKKLCQESDLQYQESCYHYLPRIYKNDSDFSDKVQTLCSGLKSEINYKSCVFGSGSMFGKYKNSDLNDPVKWCAIFDDEELICLSGIKSYQDFAF